MPDNPWISYEDYTGAKADIAAMLAAGEFDPDEARRLENEIINPFIGQSWGEYAGYQPQLQSYDTTTALQQEVMNRMAGQGGVLGEDTQAMAGSAWGQALSGQSPWQSSPELAEQAFQAQVAQPMLEQYREDILPSIQEAHVGPGTYWGSERARGERLAGQEVAEELARQRTNWQWQEQMAQRQSLEQAADRQAQAAGYIGGLGQQFMATPFQANYFQGGQLNPDTLQYFYGLGTGAGSPWSQLPSLPQAGTVTPATGVQRSTVQYV